ncbi:MAG TPA: J domain-containing protein [Epsilonproteobacteria bacterium]|nr:J domain-containing protein [Campylobacterota bacterium]
MIFTYEEINDALETMSLPRYITREDIKNRYRHLAKKLHPDVGGSAEEMERLNRAYELLVGYIEDFKYSFDEIEIAKQSPILDHSQRFKP